jgi:hypothetical protein
MEHPSNNQKSAMLANQSTVLPDLGAIYRHYKGKEYQIIAIARHTETLEYLVVYQALYDDSTFGPKAVWVRPLGMFMDMVDVEGTPVARFTRST